MCVSLSSPPIRLEAHVSLIAFNSCMNAAQKSHHWRLAVSLQPLDVVSLSSSISDPNCFFTHEVWMILDARWCNFRIWLRRSFSIKGSELWIHCCFVVLLFSKFLTGVDRILISKLSRIGVLKTQSPKKTQVPAVKAWPGPKQPQRGWLEGWVQCRHVQASSGL